MAIDQSAAIRFTPRGLSDAFDATDKFPGACQAITNLVFDPSNPELVVSKPGTVPFIDFHDSWSVNWLNPGFISIQAVVGRRIYGMIATDRFPGHDEPFCFDTSIDDFIPITGVGANNTPFSPPTTGPWVPPTLTVVGTMVVITHPGFSVSGGLLWGGGAVWGDPSHVWTAGIGYYGIIDVTVFGSPSWRSENTAVNGLTGIPQAVANYNNRAWFAVLNQVEYTDVLTNPLTRSNATQALTLGDSDSINALAGLPVQTTGSGVIGALVAWKPSSIWQITGDTTTADLAENFISLTVGTNAPRSIAQGPYGLYFTSTGGPYFVDLLGTLRPVTHTLNVLDPDIVIPFVAAQTPTRWAGAYTTSIYRVCGDTIIRGVQNRNDYWFDERKRRWTGPHTFQWDCGSALDGFFLLSTANSPGILCKSETQQTIAFTNADLGQTLLCTLLSATLPKIGDMFMKQVAESQIELSATGGDVQYTITARDDQGTQIGIARIGVVVPVPTWDSGITWDDGTLWASIPNVWGGGGLWGGPAVYWGQDGNWGDPLNWWVSNPGSGLLWGAGKRAIPHTYPVPWAAPLVFEKMELQITATASASLAIGTFYARYQRTGYMTFGPPIS